MSIRIRQLNRAVVQASKGPVSVRQLAVARVYAILPPVSPIQIRQLAVAIVARKHPRIRVLEIGQVTYLSSKNVQVIYE